MTGKRKQTLGDNNRPNFDDDGFGSTPYHTDERTSETRGTFDVEKLNRRHAVIVIGGRVMILDELKNAQDIAAKMPHERIRFLTPDAFEKLYANQLHRVGDRQDSAARLWMRNPGRRTFEGLTFDPSRSPGGSEPGGYYNLWQGFSVEPDPNASCAIFLDHLRTNVADGNEKHYRYIFGWLAHLIQRPSERIGIALVLRGRQGTGKTIVGKVVGQLFESNYALVDSSHSVVGNFNGYMASLLLLQADEGFWAGDKQAEGRLKGLVTSDYQMIEFKGKDAVKVRNFIRLMITSNSDWVVPAGQEERRFPVFDVADHCIQNHAYFAEMMEELENGGYGALLHFLQTFDLDSVDLRRIPTTHALFEQKVASLGPAEAWWFTCLQRGWILRTGWSDTQDDKPVEQEWSAELEVERVHGDYLAYCDRQGIRHKKSPAQFGIALNQLIPGLSRTRKRTGHLRTYVYCLPSLADCRDAFERSMRTGIDWETGAIRPLESPAEEGF